ncbi:MAG: hypothetical protein ABI433_12710 [Burkholderiaceae bacterium]
MATTDPSTSAWPWAPADPAEWLRSWSEAMRLVPQSLTQAINPGWNFGPTFTLNSGNSSAPQTEVEVLQHHSYGRQLGRISEALELLIEERARISPKDKRVDDFLKMKAEIDAVKLDAAAARLDALRADLAALKKSRPAEYKKLKEALRKALDA